MHWISRTNLAETRYKGVIPVKQEYEKYRDCLAEYIKILKKPVLPEVIFVGAVSGLTRQMFSKIRCKEDYIPSKSIMLSLAVGMHLTVQETERLLASGNQLLSLSDSGDLIVRFFMELGVYSLDVYNEYLFEYHQHLLGSTTREQ